MLSQSGVKNLLLNAKVILQGQSVVSGSRSYPGSHIAQVVFRYASHVAQLGTVHTPTVESEMHKGVPSLM